MGYFRRKVDRGRIKTLLRRLDELHDAALGEGAQPAVWESIPNVPPRRCYLRFSIAEQHPDSRRRTGIFVAAHDLLESEGLDAGSARSLKQALDWFDRELPAPKWLYEDKAIFLFKSDAGECTRRIWNLVRILKENGVHCEMQRIERPGRVLYEDEFQVAVVPWRSSRSL